MEKRLLITSKQTNRLVMLIVAVLLIAAGLLLEALLHFVWGGSVTASGPVPGASPTAAALLQTAG